MNAKWMVGLGALVVLSSVAACDRTTARDERVGQTTTTGASEDAKRKADEVGGKLNRAGDEVGEAAKKAAVEAQQEAKKEWKNLDVHVDTGSGCTSGGCDGGAPVKKR